MIPAGPGPPRERRTMRNTNRLLVAATLLLVLGAPLAAYTVILKDGSQLIAQEAPSIEGDQAIIVLQSGTKTSIAAAEIDLERTRKANLHELGSAVILENGQFTSTPAKIKPAREERLSDLINKRRRMCPSGLLRAKSSIRT